MPAQPDPTHPKFLEGDEMVPPRTAPAADDVEGHVRSFNQPADDETESDAEGYRAFNKPADDEAGPDDVEGHYRSF